MAEEGGKRGIHPTHPPIPPFPSPIPPCKKTFLGGIGMPFPHFPSLSLPPFCVANGKFMGMVGGLRAIPALSCGRIKMIDENGVEGEKLEGENSQAALPSRSFLLGDLCFGTIRVGVEEISPAGIEYLLQYGFSKTLQDCISSKKTRFAKKLASGEVTEGEVEEAVDAAVREKVRNIVEGTVGVLRPGRPTIDLIGKERVRVAKEFLRKTAKVLRVKLPKLNTKEYTEMMEGYLEKNRAVIEAEARNRMEARVLDF